jgi:hypothetical protein
MAERKTSSWVKPWTNVIVRSHIHVVRLAEGEPRLVGQGLDQELLDWRPADGRYAVALDEAAQVFPLCPAVGYALVSYEALRQASPESARRAALTNGSARELVEYMALHGWKGAEDSELFRAQARGGRVWLGVLRCPDSKIGVAMADRDLPEWALGVELFECSEPCGCAAALGYALPDDLDRFKWAEENRLYPVLHEFDPAEVASAAN